MNASDSLAWYCSRFSCHLPFFAWTVTREWAEMLCLRQSCLMEMSEEMYSRSMTRYGWRLFTATAFRLSRLPPWRDDRPP